MANLIYREIELDNRELDVENRQVPLSFSSEHPAPRWVGNEYLLHGERNVNLSRLKKVGAGLFNHDPDKIVGPVSNIRIRDYRGFLTLGFDDDDIGNMAFGKVRSKSLRGVSVGYLIDKAVRIFEKDTYIVRDGFEIKGPALIATRWTPYEISLTPIPLDPSTTVRSYSLDNIELEEKAPVQDTGRNIKARLRYFQRLRG
jgi:hypothetical protein